MNTLKCKIFLLPSLGRRTPIFKMNFSDTMYLSEDGNPINHNYTFYHLYFVSERLIKKGDYCINKLGDTLYHIDHFCFEANNNWYKVEATTNPELVYWDGQAVPSIPSSFIKDFISQQGNIKEVRLATTNRCINGHEMRDEGLCAYPYCHEIIQPFINVSEDNEVELISRQVILQKK